MLVSGRLLGGGFAALELVGELLDAAGGVNQALVLLAESIEHYLSQRDPEPKRYVWKAEGHAILEKIQRARAAMPSQDCV